MNFNYFEYMENDEIKFGAKESEYITFIGNLNTKLMNNIMMKTPNNFMVLNFSKIAERNIDKLRKLVGFAFFDLIDTHLGETVRDELAYSLESQALTKDEMNSRIEEISRRLKLDKKLEISPELLNISEKAKLLIGSVLIARPKILVIDNLLKLLDMNDFKEVIEYLKDYKNNGGIIFNFTSEIEESLLGDYLIISNDKTIVVSGKTLSVLNEEKLLKRIGVNLPFIVLLNKYLKDYELIDNYYLDYNELVGAIWK